MPGYRVPVHFEACPPEALTVCCSDGRFVEAVRRFAEGIGLPRHDLIAFPGGPGQFSWMTAMPLESKVVSDAFEFLVSNHGVRKVLLIAHANCAFYLRRFGREDPSRQKEDLRWVCASLLRRHPQLDVGLYFAQGHPQSGVEFEAIEG